MTRLAHGNRRLTIPLKSTAVAAAVVLALYGKPPAVHAQSAETGKTTALEEVVVTATRFRENIEAVPYNITAIKGANLISQNITDLQSLTTAVPGLSMYDIGARYAAATEPIIRGLNASTPPRGIRDFQQSAVGTYYGNSPVSGYFDLIDLSRVEVLRGPQGTLFGSGALGGVIRYIPNEPQLNEFTANLSLDGGTVAHSSDRRYGGEVVLNAPLGQTLAVRVAAKYEYVPGYIDVYGLLERSSSGIPLLANPSEPVSSPGIFYGRSDWNFSKELTSRVSLKWQPNERFTANLAYLYSNINGRGVDASNPDFRGGPYPFSPGVQFPSGGDYQDFSTEEEPYSRSVGLTSLDLSYDLGFATLSSTSSYESNRGLSDDNLGTYGLAGGSGIPQVAYYYFGFPEDPRFTGNEAFSDLEKTFTEEIRVVSSQGDHTPLQYVAGVFFQKQTSEGDWLSTEPGSKEYAIAEGCTAQYYWDAVFPNCLVGNGGPDSVFFNQADQQYFKDRSIYGSLMWHFNARAQLTLGGRLFSQNFTDYQTYDAYGFLALLPPETRSQSSARAIWNVNPSYRFANDQYIYLTWSQGFRRGGVNALPTTGFYAESPTLVTYRPDTVNNYEIGVKGRLGNGMYYSVDYFDDLWSDPQLMATLPSGNIGVFNVPKAESSGVEFQSNGPLLISGLSYSVSAAYTDARLTEGVSITANNGAGEIIPGEITADTGTQLPGSPRVSAAAALSYRWSIVPGYEASMSLNSTYRSRVLLTLGNLGFQAPTDSYLVENLSAALDHEYWSISLSVTNLTDRRYVLFPPYDSVKGTLEDLGDEYFINRPREIIARLSYSF